MQDCPLEAEKSAKEREYKVTMTATVDVEAEVVVYALSEEEAWEKANEEVEAIGLSAEDYDGKVLDVNIDTPYWDVSETECEDDD